MSVVTGRVERLREKLEANQPALGVMPTLGSELAVETYGWAGFDYVMVDFEHGSTDLSKIENLVRAAEVSGMSALARVWSHDPWILTKALDTGVMGLVVPFVNSVEQAEAIVSATRYPPVGTRGSCPAMRVARDHYMHGGYRAYIEAAGNPLVIAMIETVQGLEAVEEIAQVEHIDGLFFGPADFTLSSGVSLDSLSQDEVVRARDRVRDAAKRAGKIVMENAFTPQDVVESLQAGAGMSICATDSLALGQAARQFVDGVVAEVRGR
ncbi:MAG: HpcH/HpaI aldolase/citrate lyase family protein [Acidimicrobiia bacterium]